MREKSMFKAVGVFLLVSAAVQIALADTAGDLKMAEKLFGAGRYPEAEQAYQAVLKGVDPNKPEDLKSAFEARKRLPLVYLATDRQPPAQMAVQELLARHAGHERLPHAIHEIVEQAQKLNKTLQAGQVYQNILAAQPAHPQVIWLKMGIAITNAHLNNDQAVDSTLQNIIAQHADDERAAEALGQTAWAYRKLNQNAKARTAYQYVVDNWPNKDRAVFSQRGIILCSIALDDYASADAGVQKLLADYAGSKYMAEIVRNIAGEYYRKGKVAEASTLHQYVADKHPKSLKALWSQRDVALCCIDAGNGQAVEAALQKLVTGFAGHARLPEALADVGEYYRKKGNLQNARQVHQRVAMQFPSSPEAIQSQRNAILSSVGLNDEPQIKTGIETLLTQFTQNKDIAAVVGYVADRLGDTRDDEKLKLYQYIVDQHPKNELVVPAKARIGQIMIRRGDENGAEAVFQKILADHKGHPRLPESIRFMAEGYYEQAVRDRKQNPGTRVDDHYRKAIAKWDRAIQEAPDSATAARAYWCSAVVYSQELSEYMNGIERYQKVVDSWPDYEYAWHAQFLIGKYLEKLKDSGALSESDADPRIEQAYSRLVEKYPDSNSAPIAALKLGKMKLKKELWSDAIYYLEQFVQQENGRMPKHVVTGVLNNLGDAYERVNKPDMAAEMRRLVQKTSGPVADDSPSESIFQGSGSYYRQALQYKKQGHVQQAKDYFRKAITELERVITELPPDPAHSPRAYFMTAVCYSQELGEYRRGIEYFQRIVDDWPDYKYAWRAQYFVGRYYETLRNKGLIPESEANIKIEEAYRAVIDKYPDSESAPRSALRLGSICFQRKQWPDVTRYLEFFLQKDRGETPTLIADVIYQLGHAYEEMGELEKAQERYRIFMETIEILDPSDSRVRSVEAKLRKMSGEEK